MARGIGRGQSHLGLHDRNVHTEVVEQLRWPWPVELQLEVMADGSQLAGEVVYVL